LAEAIQQPPPPDKYPAGGTEVIEVQYSEEDQMRHFRGLLDAYRRGYAESSPKDYAFLLAIDALRCASRFKHPCFYGESEWRIVTSPGGDNFSDLFFRPSARTVIPFVKVPSGKPLGWKLPIVSVTIGPTLHQELSERSVRALLVAKGYSIQEVEIKKSDLPLALTG
jgi:hypothetical protein